MQKNLKFDVFSIQKSTLFLGLILVAFLGFTSGNVFAQGDPPVSEKNILDQLSLEIQSGCKMDLSSVDNQNLLSIHIGNTFQGSSNYIEDLSERAKELGDLYKQYPSLLENRIAFQPIEITFQDRIYKSDERIHKIFNQYNQLATQLYKLDPNLEVWKNIPDIQSIWNSVHQYAKQINSEVPEKLESFIKDERFRTLWHEELGKEINRRTKAHATPALKIALQQIAQTYFFSQKTFHNDFNKSDGKEQVEKLSTPCLMHLRNLSLKYWVSQQIYLISKKSMKNLWVN